MARFLCPEGCWLPVILLAQISFLLCPIPDRMMAQELPLDARQLELYRHGTIRILGNREETRVARVLGRLAEQHVPRLARFYDYPRVDSLLVFIAGSSGQFGAFPARLPEWAAAAYLPERRLLIVKSPRWSGSLRELEKSFSHELAHVYFYAKFGDRPPPVWLNEGLAEYLSGSRIGLQGALQIAGAVATHSLVYWDEMDSLNSFPEPRAQLSYLESLSAVKFLESRFRRESGWPQFQDRFGEDGLDSAIVFTTGMDAWQLEQAWLQDLGDRYRWFYFLNFEYLQWLLLIVVLLLAFYLIRWRNRSRIRRWEESSAGDGD